MRSMATRTTSGGRRKARSMAPRASGKKMGLDGFVSGALLMVEQTLLPHFLPHHALAAVERFGIVVSDVQPPAVGGT